jgi:cytochrome P450
MAAIQRPDYVPDHVPGHLIWDHDLNGYARALDDPYRLGDHLRAIGPPLLYTRGATRGQPGWVPTTYALMSEIFMDTENFSSEGNVGIAEMLGMANGLVPLETDPPMHRPLRSVLNPILGPAPVAKFEPVVRKICVELIEKFATSWRTSRRRSRRTCSSSSPGCRTKCSRSSSNGSTASFAGRT